VGLREDGDDGLAVLRHGVHGDEELAHRRDERDLRQLSAIAMGRARGGALRQIASRSGVGHRQATAPDECRAAGPRWAYRVDTAASTERSIADAIEERGMRASELQEVRSRLQRRRDVILAASQRTAAEIGEMRSAERDPELEESSQSEQQQYNLARIGEVERAELDRIDAALRRLDAGEYGTCRDCGAEIDAARLAAVPFALECPECASGREESARQAGRPPRTSGS
jgi:DnaK suppressor protein